MRAKVHNRPILFSAGMVRALLDGRKTQTRRIIKPQPAYIDEKGTAYQAVSIDEPSNLEYHPAQYPYGQPGDLLWVRESFTMYDDQPLYKTGKHDDMMKWKPSIHMPRWASRLTLKIKEIRVERLQDISNEDAVAEGIGTPLDMRYAALDEFKPLWDSINAKRHHGKYAWDKNPWVWVIVFEVIKQNIDQLK